MKKYIIDKDNPNEKLLYYNVNVVGLSVTPNKSVPGYNVIAKKLTLVDPELREAYIKQKINKKIDKVNVYSKIVRKPFCLDYSQVQK